MTGIRFVFPAALLLGLFTVAGCANTGVDRYGRPTYGRTDGAYGRAGTYNYPDYAKTGGGSGANARYRVCHNGRNTLTLPAPAVRAHLNHGDHLGNCTARDRRRYDDWRRRSDTRWENRDRDDDDDRRRNRNRGRGNGRGNGRGR